MNLFEKHQNLLESAIKALHDRAFFTPYPEHPSPKVYGDSADGQGRERFEQQLGNKFEALHQVNEENWIGEEESPYTQERLDISYPQFGTAQLLENANSAFHSWRKVSIKERAGVLLESLERVKARFFEIAYATMHTTGQGYMMAFQASGPHAADRALEAIAMGYEELNRFPENTFWDKPMGKYSVQLDKKWRAVPKGTSVCIGCSTFPTWNTVPGVYASLITGNPVIVKPHPGAVLPIAIVVAEIQNVLKEAGYDTNVCQLAVDGQAHLITKELVEHESVKLVDFTGNSEFGHYLERLEGKNVFTEKTGVNSVILDSMEHLDKVVANLAFSVTLYSGQMCTTPQNFFIPQEGIRTPEGIVTFDEFAQKFVEAINNLIDNPKVGPVVLGAIKSKKTYERVTGTDSFKDKVLLTSRTVENPLFKNARTASPTIIVLDADDQPVFAQEMFGPIIFLIKTKNAKQSLALAKAMAMEHGAISCGAYTLDNDMKENIIDEMELAATPVSFNLTGGIYVNQNASFSDFHVTGGNPAGNASFTNPEFVVKRFTWVGFREPATVS